MKSWGLFIDKDVLTTQDANESHKSSQCATSNNFSIIVTPEQDCFYCGNTINEFISNKN